MIRKSYLDFVSSFSRLSPYELDHFCESLHVNFEEMIAQHSQGNPVPVSCSIQNIKQVVTRAMREVQIELAEGHMQDAQLKLEKTKALTFAPRRVSEEDMKRLLKDRETTLRSASAG